MAATGDWPTEPPSGPDDDINTRLAEVAAELAAEARFKEPSAAERARMSAGHARSVRSSSGPGPLRARRNRRTAAVLRKPVLSGSAAARAQVGGRPARRRRPHSRAVHIWRYLVSGRWLPRRMRGRGRPEPVPDRGYATAYGSTRGRSLAIVLAAMVLLIAICAVIVALVSPP